MTNISLTTSLTASDATTLFALAGDKGFKLLSSLGAKNAKISTALKSLDFQGKLNEVVTLPGSVASSGGIIIVVGVGDNPQHDNFRKATGTAARQTFGLKKWSIIVPDEYSDATGAISEAALLGTYAFNAHRAKSNTAKKQSVKSISIVSKDGRNAILKKSFERAKIVATAVNHARDLANTAPGHLPPAAVADFAKKQAKEVGLTIEVLDEKALQNQGFGGIVGVGQGSARPPRLVRLSYRPRKAVAHIALVGKGITFDTGGISLKPPLNMHEMKADMSGAAAVIAAIVAIKQLNIPVAVTTYAALAENMPGGSAQRPGDVVIAYGGRSVEVLNTDAEGRLVLMDAIVRAQEDKPDLIVDVATLTGAAVIALGKKISAVMANDDEMRDVVVDAAGRSGEYMWPLPLPQEYRGKLDSVVADIANIGDSYGGALYGGLFLQEFVKSSQKWVHIDIAAPAFNSEAPYDYHPKGATGPAVRTLVTLAEDVANGLVKL